MENKKNILFFSRVQYAYLYPKLKSNSYDSFHATMNKKEKEVVLENGGKVVGCFEEEFDALEVAKIPDNFLQTGFYADRFMGWLSLDERIEILGKCITFWRNIHKERNYIACVHETITIEIEEVFSKVADEFSVKDLNAIESVVEGYFYWKKEAYSSSIPQKEIDSLNYNNKHIEEATTYIKKTKYLGHKTYWTKTNNCSYNIFKYVVKDIIKRYLKYFISREILKHDTVFYYASRYNIFGYKHFVFECAFRNQNYYNDIRKYSDKKKIFFPLHQEPEATLLYFAPKYSNQVNVIQEISKILPEDYVLVIKEHPWQPKYLKRLEYQQLRERNSNIIYLAGSVDSHSIVKNSEAVITITGSVGWEALVNNIPVFLLGSVFYDKHPDVMKIGNYDDIKKILLEKKLIRPNDNHTLIYLAKLLSYSYQGFPTMIHLKGLSDKDNINNIISSIEEEIGI